MAKEDLKSLYVRLGLDISQIAQDFLAADKTINENMAKLNRESNIIKLRAAVDIASLGNAADQTKVLEIQEEALNRQLEIQERRCRLASLGYQDIARRTGEASNATQRAAIALERERLAAQNLRNELNNLNQQRAAQNPQLTLPQSIRQQQQQLQGQMSNYVSQLQNLSNFNGGADAIIGLAGRIPGAYGQAAQAFLATAKAAYDMKKAIVDVGTSTIKKTDEVYKAAQKMQMTVVEYGSLNKILTLGGSSMDVFSKGIVKLNKSVITAGTNGNDVTRMLEKFGVVLQENGHLVGYNEELKRLAEGLKNAKANGEGLEYVTTLFGAKAAELVPILENYYELVEDAKGVVKPLGVDPQEAHEAARQLAVMEQNVKNLGSTAMALLVPISEHFIPDISAAAANTNEVLKTLFDLVKSGAKEIDELLNKFPKFREVAGSMWESVDVGGSGPLFTAMKNSLYEISDLMKENGQENWVTKLSDSIKENEKNITEAKQVHTDFSDSIQDENEEAASSFDDLSNNVEDNSKEMQAALKELEDSHKNTIEHLRNAEDIYYKQSHNELENSIYSVNRWKDTQLEKARTAEEAASIVAEAAARESEAYEKAADKANKANQTLYEKIFKLNHNDTQNQLFDLYKEIFDYRQQGADEGYIAQYQKDRTREIMEQARKANKKDTKKTPWSNWDAIHEYNEQMYGGTYKEQLNKTTNSMMTMEQQQRATQNAVIDYEKIANVLKMNNRDITVNANFSNLVVENEMTQNLIAQASTQIAKDIRDELNNPTGY